MTMGAGPTGLRWHSLAIKLVVFLSFAGSLVSIAVPSRSSGRGIRMARSLAGWSHGSRRSCSRKGFPLFRSHWSRKIASCGAGVRIRRSGEAHAGHRPDRLPRGSVSKLYTDLAVMQLVEQGKVDLDAAVIDYFRSSRP